jgi:heptosyltransferase I
MKILIFTKNWLGDVLFELPAIDMIHHRYPDAEIICISPDRCREILEAHPAVSRVLVFDEKKQHRSFWSRIRFAFNLRKEKADRGYLFHRSKSRAFIFWLAGIKERVGYGRGRKLFLTQPITEPDQPFHHMDYFIEMLVRAGYERPENPTYRFYISLEDRQRAEQLLARNQLTRYVCFHLGANWEPKRWPTRHFAKLADLIHEKWQLPIVITGAAGDLHLEEEMRKHVEKTTVISFIGQTRIGETAAIFEKSLFVISGDSGPMHIASGVGARVLALFGPTDPKLTGPRGIGPSCVLSYVPEGFSIPWFGKDFPSEWLSRIEPKEVVQKIEEKKWFLPSTDALFAGRKKNKNEKPGGSILIVTLSNIGDVILTTPVISSLAARYPESKITVVVGPRAKNVLESSRKIDRLIVYDKHASLSEKWRFLKQLREESYDLVVDLRNTAIPFLVKNKRRSRLFRKFSSISFREKHLEVLKWLHLNSDAIPFFDFYNEADEASVHQKILSRGLNPNHGYIVIAPIAASSNKTWNIENFKKVITQLLRDSDLPVFLVGSPKEKSLLEPLISEFPSRIFNFAGETTLPELAALIAKASLVLANDSSILQLAYELDRPAVAIFGPTNWNKSGRQGRNFRTVRFEVACSPCELAQCKFERQTCFEDLQVEDVVKSCFEVLGKKEVGGRSKR